ncbi:MAG TPA: hypothetical protein VNI01_16805 [Elusimicrobiota bacterium]|jgi:hypothetical protein|nr:hypothetical protein [Elusimicrobiota bacterium]
MLARISLLALLACGAAAQTQRGEDGDVLTAHDGRGNIGTAYNQFDGRSYSIWITRMTSTGYVVWTYQHSDGYVEKAYSTTMDQNGNLFVAGLRTIQREKHFLLIKYADNGYLAWEASDDRSDCTATTVAVDQEGGVAVAGVCRSGGAYPARIVKYSAEGGRLWSQEYDNGGRNYVRGLQVDYQGNFSMSVETVAGDYRDGSYATRSVTYGPTGQLLEVR